METKPTFGDRLKEAASYRPLQIVVLIAIVVVVIYLFGRSAGKAAVSGQQVPYPKGDGSLSSDWVKNQSPAIIVKIYNAMGWTASENFGDAVLPILQLSDGQVVYIYNEYNREYRPDKKSTLTQDMQGQVLIFGRDTRNKAVNRLKGLGCN